MLKGVLHRRRSVVLTWLISYLTILLLPLIVSVFVYFVSSRTLESEIHQANRSLLSQVQEVMDNHFEAMERLNFELTWNINVQDLLYSNKYEAHPAEFNYDTYFIAKNMTNYESAYTLVDEFYLYVKQRDIVIMPSKVRTGDYSYNMLHSGKSPTYAQWYDLVNQNDYHGFVPMERIDDNGKVRRTVAYISSYTLGKSLSPATNVIMVDQNRILGAIDNVELFSKGHVFILNDQNDVLVSNADEQAVKSLPFERMEASSGTAYTTVDGSNYEVLYMKSQRSNLKYVSMIPSGLYWEKAKLIRNLTIASSIVSLLGGMLLAMFFLYRNYNPVRRLVQAMSGKADIRYGAGGNEFQFIQQAFDSTLSKMGTLQLQMERQSQILRNNFLVRLLKGRLDGTIPVAESVAAFQMRISSDDFAVILLYTESVEEFYGRIGEMEMAEKRRLLHFIITNVVEEIASQQSEGYVAEIDEALACLINFRDTPKEERAAELQRIACEAQRFLAGHYAIHLTLSISAVHSGIVSIPQAYQEALDAMEYKLVMGSKEILSYETLRRRPTEELGYYYPLQIEQQLINYLKVGDFAKAMAALEEIIQENFGRPAVSSDFARCLMLNLVSTMIKAVSETGSLGDSFLVRNPKRIKQLMACETIHDMREEMTRFVQEVCDYNSVQRQRQLQATRLDALQDRIEQIKELIRGHYMDANLNISAIGHHFDMKPTYLSKLFKDHTGEGLLDFINMTRIEQAKHLIAEQQRNVSDVAASVGFNDVNAFIRTFKKYEGITPGKFKELAAEQRLERGSGSG
jgi:YesN/AraC family two-component response regulator